MLSNTIDFFNLNIIKDDFITFDNTLEFENERGFLYDDMFLAKAKNANLLLDIGWITINEKFDEGFFKISIIEDENWDFPILNLKANNKKLFFSKLNVTLIFLSNYESIFKI